jgi:ribonuclease D
MERSLTDTIRITTFRTEPQQQPIPQQKKSSKKQKPPESVVQLQPPTHPPRIPGRRITKEQLCKLPLLEWTGRTLLLETLPEMQEAVADILNLYQSNTTLVLGFDTESRPNFAPGRWNPVALVQIATADCVYLFRLCKVDYSMDCLLPIFTSPVYKCGVSIRGDVLDLLKKRPFRPDGFFELTNLTRQLGYEQGGLANLSGLILGRNVNKSKKLAMTRWDKDQLLPREISYAATDAYLGRELYLAAVAEQTKKQLPAILPLSEDSFMIRSSDATDTSKKQKRTVSESRKRNQRYNNVSTRLHLQNGSL